MTHDLDRMIRELDPARSLDTGDVDAAWRDLTSRVAVAVPTRRRRSRPLVTVGSIGALVTAGVLLVSTLTTSPLSAAAATLSRAAHLDMAAAALPALSAGQSFHQLESVTATCQFTSPTMPAGSAPITYHSTGTVESWTSSSGATHVTITPSTVALNGGFASATDLARWESLGRPFIPCALGGSDNTLNANPANANPGAYGGFSTSVVGWSGFGFNLGSSVSSITQDVARVNALPSDPNTLATMLAAGEIAPDGTVSSTPQSCPVGASASGSGCSPVQQVQVIAQLLQLPDASAKLGSALYQVAAGLPGTSLIGTVTTPLGATGTALSVPLSSTETLELVIDPMTGALLEASAFSGSTSLASINYGAITVGGNQPS